MGLGVVGRVAALARCAVSGPGNRQPNRPATERDLATLAVGRAERSAATGWTDARLLLLESLWDAGHSAAIIGVRLQKSKNAIIGKVHRLGLPRRSLPIAGGNDPDQVQRREARAQRAAQRELAKAPKPAFVPPAVAVQAPHPVRAGTGGDCQWPTTVNGRHRMLCDAPCERGKPYCAGHLWEGTSGRPQLSERLRAKLVATHAG